MHVCYLKVDIISNVLKMDFPPCWTIHNQYGRSSIGWASKSIFKTSSRSSKIIQQGHTVRQYVYHTVMISWLLLRKVWATNRVVCQPLSAHYVRWSVILNLEATYICLAFSTSGAPYDGCLQVAYPSGTTRRGRPVVDRFLLALPMPELHTDQPKRTRLARVI